MPHPATALTTCSELVAGVLGIHLLHYRSVGRDYGIPTNIVLFNAFHLLTMH